MLKKERSVFEEMLLSFFVRKRIFLRKIFNWRKNQDFKLTAILRSAKIAKY